MHKYLYKQYYFIEKFDKNHLKKINKKINLIYRNYSKVHDERTIKNLARFCSIENRKLFIANDFKLALKMNINGVYLPSFNKSIRYNCFNFNKNFVILGSAHNIVEVNTKIRQRVKYIFIAPVFKKKLYNLGIYGFLKLKNFTDKKLIVLGGVTIEKMNMINFLNAEGFAGINYFKKKRPL